VADTNDKKTGPVSAPPPGATGSGGSGGVIDLTTVAPVQPASGAAGGTGGASPDSRGTATGVSGYTLDKTRQLIAFFLLGILALIVLVQVIGSAVFAGDCWFFDHVKGSCPQAQASLGVLTSALGSVFTAMIGLVGSVVGFYFGSQKQG
jgi:hypothetical protein